MMTRIEGPQLTTLVVDGVDIPVGEGEAALTEDMAMTRVFDILNAIEEAECQDFILSTSTSHG